MANTINILTGDSYTAVYVNGSKVCDVRGSGNIDTIIESVCGALDKSVDKGGTEIFNHEDTDFDWEKIWVNGKGYVENWADVEAARLDD